MSSQGYRCLSSLQSVNFNDKAKYIKLLNERLGILTDSYKVTTLSKITFTYVVGIGEALNTAKQLAINDYKVSKHAYNNLQLPLTMDVSKFGRIVKTKVLKNGSTKYLVIENKLVFVIIVSKDGLTNNVYLTGDKDLEWVDTHISDNAFKRGEHLLCKGWC